MKKTMRILAALTALLLLAAPAALADAGTITMSGTLQPGDIKVITSPISGSILETAEAGDLVTAGSPLAIIDTVRIYAPCDGTVAGLRAEEGDSLAEISALYGAAMYLEPASRYLISATTTNAYDSNDNRIIHVGERVYLTSVNNSDRTGEGLITSVIGESYTVEVLDSNLRLNETARVSRDEDSSDTKGRIGQGKTARNNPIPINAEGSVVQLHVREGDEVKKGDLLMEIAPDRLDDPTSGVVTAETDLIVLSTAVSEGGAVKKGMPVAAVFETGSLRAVVQVDEDDLMKLAVGDSVIVSLDVDPDEYSYEGEIEKISYIPSETAMGLAYDVTVRFENDDIVRMGMSVTVETEE